MYERKITVLCSNCHVRHNEEDVDIKNISENIMGEDVVSFTCINCNKETESRRYG